MKVKSKKGNPAIKLSHWDVTRARSGEGYLIYGIVATAGKRQDDKELMVLGRGSGGGFSET